MNDFPHVCCYANVLFNKNPNFMRTVKQIHKAQSGSMGGLITYCPLPTSQLDQIDPFIFLNHHGPQTFEPNNQGLPFGPHPHRGMETVTFIREGDVVHQDSQGHSSQIEAGGIQWMTAGSGLLHSEVSSEAFKKEGGTVEILQLWVNLPANLKMTPPAYKGLQGDEIPLIKPAAGVEVKLVAGELNGQKGGIEPLTDIMLSEVNLQNGAEWSLKVPENRNILLYVINGEVTVNEQTLPGLYLAELDNDAPGLTIRAQSDSVILFGHTEPFNEPMVARGPFVMNSNEEIEQAYQDFREGKMGVWSE